MLLVWNYILCTVVIGDISKEKSNLDWPTIDNLKEVLWFNRSKNKRSYCFLNTSKK